MLDVAVSYNRYKFLGHEFLTWLWFVIDNEIKLLEKTIGHNSRLEIGNRIVFENRSDENTTEKITIKGDDAGLEEGLLSLKKGAMVTELNIVYKIAEKRWQFTIKGENFHITQIKIPDSPTIETGHDTENIVLVKAELCEKMFIIIDSLYDRFIKLRISDNWKNNVVPKMKKWMRN